MISKLLQSTLFTFTFFSGQVFASYHWIDANDLHMRADIQLLADVGVITTPTSTYPLMWSGVMQGINNAKIEELSPKARDAYQRVNQRYKQYRKDSSVTKFSLGGTNNAPRFKSYGSPVREKTEMTIQNMGEFSRFSYNLAATYADGAAEGDKYRFDGSYVSMLLGNWFFSAGSYGEWYGQGWNSTLLKSTSARPMSSFMITRNNAQAVDIPVFEWLGPWTLTTGVSVMDDDKYRSIKNALLWSFRTAFKPHPNLEFGIGRTAQICGDDKGCGFSDWGKMLTGDTNVTGGEENPANQVASVDIRWGDTVNGIPYGVYWEALGEDDFQLDNFPPFGKKSYLTGVDVSYTLYGNSIRTFFEYSDTYARCGSGNENGDCTYEHSTYTGGYRYNGSSVGSTYDNDSFVYALGFIGFVPNGDKWKANFRYMDLNLDNTNRGSQGGNTVAPVGEQARQMDVTYIWSLFGGELETGVAYTYSTFIDDLDSKTQVDVWGKWSYIF